MKNQKRINVNLSDEEFTQLDIARAKRGEKWQSLIHRLLLGWVSGESVGESRTLGLPWNLTDADVELLREAALEISEANAKANIEKLAVKERAKEKADKNREPKKR